MARSLTNVNEQLYKIKSYTNRDTSYLVFGKTTTTKGAKVRALIDSFEDSLGLKVYRECKKEGNSTRGEVVCNILEVNIINCLRAINPNCTELPSINDLHKIVDQVRQRLAEDLGETYRHISSNLGELHSVQRLYIHKKIFEILKEICHKKAILLRLINEKEIVEVENYLKENLHGNSNLSMNVIKLAKL